MAINRESRRSTLILHDALHFMADAYEANRKGNQKEVNEILTRGSQYLQKELVKDMERKRKGDE